MLAHPGLGWGPGTTAVDADLISESGSFPAPSPALFVHGAVAEVVPRVGGTNPLTVLLTKNVGVYIGDTSYSLHL